MNHLSSTYVESRFRFSTDEWPPYHPTHYTTLALIHHKGRHADTRVISQELVSKGNIFLGSYSKSQIGGEYNNVTIDISELFSYSMQASSSASFILIEGAPGIGKTVLSKEIAYLWAVKKLLTLKKLVFLIYLRDPHMKNIYFVEDLAQHMVKHGKLASSLGEYLFDTKGKDLVVILDGYDEMSEEDRKNSFIANIIKREILPQCDLVVTSRPTASVHLRDIADCRVEVLGFTEENRLDYIKHALEGSGDKIEGLQFYLQSNPTINALCYIPLNMTILLCLFEGEGKMESANTSTQSDCTQRLGNLPNTQTEMYRNFILMTINRSIKKEKQSSGDLLLKNLSNLPEPHNKMFEDLCQLAFNALRLDKIVFEFDEIENICPNITMTPDSWSGLGLLKAVRFVTNVSFHFLHFSIQEYLAAYHIASLSNSEQIKLLSETFWEIHYFNTWIMYVGITGGEQFSWRHFISGNWFQLSTWLFGTSTISKKLLGDKIRCLHLFQCYAEIGGHEAISKLFDEEVIDLSNHTLLPKDINTLGFFLLRSSGKQWKILDLSNCSIGDVGCNILHQQFWDKSSRQVVNIKKVNFSHNRLHVPSILTLMDVFQAWHVSQAVVVGDDEHNDINNDYLFEMFVNKFLNCVDETASQIISVCPFLFANKAKQRSICHYLNDLIRFEALYLKNCHWEISESEMKELSTALLKQNDLHKVHIMGNALPDCIMRDIVTNASSVFVCDYTLPDKYLDNIAGVLKWTSSTCNWLLIGCNKTLGKIQHTCSVQLSTEVLPKLLANVKKVPLSSPAFSSKVLCKLELVLYDSKCVFQGLLDSWHSCDAAGQTSICLVENDVLIASKISFYDIGKVLASLKLLTSIFISNCSMSPFVIADLIGEQELLSFLYITDCHLVLQFVNNICTRFLNRKSQLKELFVHTTNLLFSLTSDVLELLSNDHNTSTVLVTKDTLACQNPTDLQIVLALKLESKVTIWKFCNCFLNYQTYCHTVGVFAANTTNLVALDFSGCTLGQCELEMFNACFNQSQCASHLTTLKMCYSKIHKTLASTLALANKLEELDLRSNDLQAADIIDILKGTAKISTLKVFNISYNNITDAAASCIAVLLSNNNNLDTVDLSYNNLQAAGAVEILRGMQYLSTLRRLNISNNNITDEAAADITSVLVCNTKLEEIDLSCNRLHVKSAVAILKGSMNVLTAANYNFGFNSITGHAVDEIITALSQGTNLNDNISNSQTNASDESFIAIGNLSNLVNIVVCSDSASQAGKRTVVIVSRDIISDLYHSDLKVAKVLKTLKEIENISNLTKLCIINSCISDTIANDLSVVLSHNAKLEQLVLSHNNLQTLGTTRIFRGMKETSTLILLVVSHNNLFPAAAKSIANVLSHNLQLEELDLSCNNMLSEGIIPILQVSTNISNLKRLNISGNNITEEAANDVGDVLSHNTKLEELNLSCNSLQAASAIKIFNGMKEIVTLKKLIINKNSISDEVTDYLVPILCCNTKLEEIDLSYNRLQVAGIVKILNELINISSLKLFNINNNCITDEIASSISTILSHNNEQISDEPASGIKAVLSNNNELEQIIDLSEIKISIALLVLKEMSNGSTLKQFNMSSDHISHKAAKDIAVILSYAKLEEIDLSGNHLQKASAIEIFNGTKNFLNLGRFKVNTNSITEKVAKNIAVILSHNTKLKELDLSCKHLHKTSTIDILNGMKNIQTLKRFKFSNNSISDCAVDYLAEVLSHNAELEELDLSYNALQVAGTVKILKGMKRNSNLKKLNISNNNITNEAAKDVLYHPFQNSGALDVLNGIKNISTLKAVNISSNGITDDAADDIVAVLSNNMALEEVDLSYNKLQAAGIIKILKGIKNSLFSWKTKKLILSHKNITDEIEVALHSTILDEVDSGIEMQSRLGMFCAAGNQSNLVNLSVCINYEAGNKCIVGIVSGDISDLYHGDLKIAKVLKALKKRIENTSNLTKLCIVNSCISDTIVDDLSVVLSHTIKLEQLVLSCNNLQTLGTTIIFGGMKETSTLTVFTVSHNNLFTTAAKSIANVLSHNPKLEELDLSYNNMQSAGVIVNMKGIVNISTLKRLNISSNDITEETANYIGDVLSHNTKLEELDLSCNSLQAAGAIKIFNSMVEIVTLKRFSISKNSITDEVTDYLVPFLCCNTKLEEIDLSYNRLQVAGIVQILKGLKDIPSLKLLKISNGYITDEIASDILAVLSHNNEQISDEPASGIKAVLPNNNKIQEIDLSEIETSIALIILKGVTNISSISVNNNSVSHIAAMEMAVILSHNKKLDKLDLSCNQLQTASAIEIFSRMKHFSDLKIFKIRNNDITDEVAKYIATIFVHNTKLEELDLSCNCLQTSGTLDLLNGMKNISTLKAFSICNNGITDDVADDIVAVLSNNKALEEIDLSYNKLQAPGVIKILEGMKNSLTLKTKKLNLSYNNITDEIGSNLYNTILDEVDSDIELQNRLEIFSAVGNLSNLVNIAVCVNHGSTFQGGNCIVVIMPGDIISDLYYSDLRIATVLKTLKRIKNISYLIEISIVNCFINDNIANDLSVVLSRNVKLKKLVLIHNNLQPFCNTKMFGEMRRISSLTLLTVSHNNISPAAAMSIAHVLSHSPKLEELNLSCNSLQAAGAIKIFNGMVEIVTLKRFSISKNGITDEVIDYLVPILCRNTKLEEIDLSYNRLQVAGVVKVLKGLKDISSLKLLKISNGYITDEIASDILAVLSHNNERIIDEPASGIKASNNELEQIDLSEIKTTIALLVLKELSSTSTLKQFSMRNNNISCKAAKDLAVILSYSNTLEELDLSCNDMQSTSAMEIFSGMTAFSNLRRFKINTNNITDAVALNIAVILSCNSKLEELELRCDHFDLQTTSAIEICNGIKRISTLRRFSISNNLFGDFAADYLAEVLSHSTKLEELDLSCNTLQTAGAAKILEAAKSLFNLIKIKISNSGIFAKDITEAILSRNVMLQELDLSCNFLQNSGTVDVVNIIKNVSTLRKLSISDNGITDDAADHIATLLSDNVTLEEVNLSCNRLQAAGVLRIVKQVNNTATMKRLDLSQNNITSHEFLLSLNSTKLEEFDDNMEMQRRLEIFCVIENPSNLVNMIVSNFGTACQTTNTVIAVMPFRIPDLSHSDVKIKLLKLLRGMEATTNITKLQICHCYITHEAADDLAVVLSHSLELKQLVLCNNNVHSAGTVKIIQGLKGLSNLAHINISDHYISNEAADDLAIVLSHSSRLEQLILCHNNIQSIGAPLILQRIVKDISGLKQLNLSGNGIEDDEAMHLAKFLSCNSKLELVCVGSNRLQSQGISKIFKGMKNLLNLKKVDISKNFITYEAGDTIGDVLSHNRQLKELNFSHNNLGAAGINKVFQGLTSVSYLTKLNISHTNLTDKGADAVAAVLSHNDDLKEIDLSSNVLQPAGIITIFNSMQNIFCLTKLVVSYNNVTNEAADSIASVLSHNYNLQWLHLEKANMQLEGMLVISKTIKYIPIKLLDIKNNGITLLEANIISNYLHCVTHLEFN